MKKLLALILAAAMSLSLAACGNGSTSSGGGSTSEPAGTPAASSGEETGWVPTEDIEFVIPFGAGGGNDVMVRKILEIVEKYDMCPVNIVPVNKEGGSGVVGYTYLTSKGAGYEYALASTSASFYTQPLTGNSPFTPDESTFSFVAHMVKDPVVLVAHPSYGFTCIQDVVDYAKEYPGELKWGGVGNASDDAIIMYMLNNIAGIDLTYVPYDDEEYVRLKMEDQNTPTRFLFQGEAPVSFGQSGTVLVYRAYSEDTLVVPKACVQSDELGSFVNVIKEDGSREKTYVSVGIQTDAFIEITEGLEEGDVVYANE